MGNKLFVGSFGLGCHRPGLGLTSLARVGTVTSAKVIVDRDTNRPKALVL